MDVAAQAYPGGEIRPADLTGREFVSLLKELRLIFLQDAAILQPIYPDLPLWRLPILEIPNGTPSRKPFATVKRWKKSPPTCG